MNKQTEALRLAIEALKGKTDKAQAIQACKEALEQPAQEYLTRAQQVIRANNSAQEHCVNLKMDKCEHKNICEHCTHPAPQPAQEPVAWMSEGGIFTRTKEHAEIWSNNGGKVTPVYTHPTPSLVGLSDDEVQEVFNLGHKTFKEFARAIEQALKEKNHAER